MFPVVPFIFGVGRLMLAKGWDHLVRACALLRASHDIRRNTEAFLEATRIATLIACPVPAALR